MAAGHTANAYAIELLYTTPPVLSKDEIAAALRTADDSIVPVDDSALLAFCRAGSAAPQWLFAPGVVDVDEAGRAVSQTWTWPEAAERVGEAQSSILFTDLMAGGVEYTERLATYQRFLHAFLDYRPCVAIHWKESQQIVNPLEIHEAFAHDGPSTLYGALNIRFHAEEKSPGKVEFLMDTLGLAPFGLPDLQCHFRGLNPDDVGHLLFTTAHYLFEKGPVIATGHTIHGLTHEQRWTCRIEDSLMDPPRAVIDVDPGESFAAGERPY